MGLLRKQDIGAEANILPWGEVKMALLSKTSSVTHLVNVLLFLMAVQAQ